MPPPRRLDCSIVTPVTARAQPANPSPIQGARPDVVGGFPAADHLGVRRHVAAFGRDDKSSSSPMQTRLTSPTTSGCTDSGGGKLQGPTWTAVASAARPRFGVGEGDGHGSSFALVPESAVAANALPAHSMWRKALSWRGWNGGGVWNGTRKLGVRGQSAAATPLWRE